VWPCRAPSRQRRGVVSLPAVCGGKPENRGRHPGVPGSRAGSPGRRRPPSGRRAGGPTRQDRATSASSRKRLGTLISRVGVGRAAERVRRNVLSPQREEYAPPTCSVQRNTSTNSRYNADGARRPGSVKCRVPLRVARFRRHGNVQRDGAGRLGQPGTPHRNRSTLCDCYQSTPTATTLSCACRTASNSTAAPGVLGHPPPHQRPGPKRGTDRGLHRVHGPREPPSRRCCEGARVGEWA
jgi:hypothetical protein